MPTRNASARWEGSLKDGDGTMKLGSGAYEGPYTYESRFEEGDGTNPEELIGAAHAGCYSMFLSLVLGEAGHEPESIATDARVHLDKGDDGFDITRIELITRGRVPGLDAAEFERHAQTAKQSCPVSKALTGPEVSVDASLED